MSLLDLITDSHAKVLKVSGGCHNCPRKRVDFVPPTLNPGSVLFLGESPGNTEVEKGEGFTGQSGSFLRQTAREEGVPEPWSFSYVAHCRTPGGDAPGKKEVNCCLSQFVLDEIKDYSLIVLVGNAALQALFPGAKYDHFRGNVAWHPDFPSQRFFHIQSPTDVLKRPHMKETFRKHLNRLARIAKGEPAPAWRIVRGAEGLEVLKRMVTEPLLSIDYETNRLESWAEGGKIKSLAVTNVKMKDVVVAYEDDPYFEAMLDLLADFMSKPEKSAVGAHISFDLEWTERERGIRVQCELIHDVAIQWYHAGQYKQASLKELVSEELDGYRYLIHNPHEIKDVELLLRYGAEDVVRPMELMKKAMQRMRPRTRDLTTRVLGPADLVLQRVHAHGLYIRHDYRQQKIDEYRERRKQLINDWKAADPEFIPDTHESGDGLISYLFTIRGLPVLETVSDGSPSTDKSVLKQLLRDGNEIVKFPLAMREIDKIESTYLRAYDKHVWPDQRVRSSYPLTWTDSGRSSSRSPNLQNIPRKKEIRDLFGVPPGSVMIESDLSQIEFRIMVCLAQDETGIAGYLRGDDAHTTTARRVAGVDKPTKEQRSLAKPINFGFLYGAQARMVQQYAADEYGVLWTLDEAENFRNIFFDTYKRLPEFHAGSKARLIQNRGWFESVVGHVFHYKEWDHKDQGKRDHSFRAALNAEAQGPAAQLCFYIMVLTRRLLDKHGFQTVEFVNHVHDSMMMEVPNPAWVPDVISIVEEARGQAYEWVKDWFVVPLVMEHSVGESWGSLKEYHLAA